MSRIITLVCVLLLVVYCLVSSGQAEPGGAAIARKPRYSWRQTDSSLALLNHGRIVWQLNFNKKEGKPCFHPVGLIDGTVLTWLRPADHRWHRALWFSWKFINGLNYWEEDPKTGLSEGRMEIVSINVIPHDDYSARIAMMLSYHRPGEPAVLTEKRLIAVSAPDKNGQYHIDWHSTFTAGEKDVVLDRTPLPGEEGGKGFGGYAGLSVRMAKATRGWEFVDSEGRKDKEAHGKKARWVDFSGEIGEGKAAGVTIFDHPENLRHPSPWYVAKGMPYFSPAVLFNKSYTLAAGKSLTLRYRILIHPGRADKDILKSEWNAFSELKAGKDTTAEAQPLSFGPLIEQVLSIGSMSFMIDFDTGKTGDPPASTDRPDLKGMDAYAAHYQPYLRPTGLIGSGLKAIPVTPEQWDTLPSEVVKVLSQVGLTTSSEMNAKEFPATFFFKTREGGVGILQITGFTDKPKGVKIRYKMVVKKATYMLSRRGLNLSCLALMK